MFLSLSKPHTELMCVFENAIHISVHAHTKLSFSVQPVLCFYDKPIGKLSFSPTVLFKPCDC